MNLSCQNQMCSLSHFLTQSWSLEKRNLISSLESDGLEMGSVGENVMDYVALVGQQACQFVCRDVQHGGI